MSKGSWRGLPLESYSKEELIEIVLSMGRLNDGLREQSVRDRDWIRGKPNWAAAFYLFGGITFGLVVVGLLLRWSLHSS